MKLADLLHMPDRTFIVTEFQEAVKCSIYFDMTVILGQTGQG